MWYTFALAIGIILLITSIFILRESLSFLRISERAVGTVIEVKKIETSDGFSFKPVFKFKTSWNEEVIYTHNFSTNPPSWSIGDEAVISYDPNKPTVARLLTYFGTFSWTIVLMSIAMPLIVIGGGYHLSQYYLK